MNNTGQETALWGAMENHKAESCLTPHRLQTLFSLSLPLQTLSLCTMSRAEAWDLLSQVISLSNTSWSLGQSDLCPQPGGPAIAWITWVIMRTGPPPHRSVSEVALQHVLKSLTMGEKGALHGPSTVARSHDWRDDGSDDTLESCVEEEARMPSTPVPSSLLKKDTGLAGWGRVGGGA